jgi:hypothetical protein
MLDHRGRPNPGTEARLIIAVEGGADSVWNVGPLFRMSVACHRAARLNL